MSTDFRRSFAARLIGAVASNLRRIALLCLVVAAASSVYALTRKQYWAASAVAAVPGGQQSSLGLGGIAGTLIGDRLGNLGGLMGAGGQDVLDLNLVYQVLTSRVVYERVIFKYDLIADLKAPTWDDVLRNFRKRASVYLTPEGFFVISMEARTRENAAAIVNDIIDFANEELSTIITSRARRSRLAAEELLAAAAESLDVAQRNMERFRRETGLVFPEEQGMRIVELLASLETELILAEAELAGIAGSMSASSPAYREISRKISHLRGAIAERVGEGTTDGPPGMDGMPAVLHEYENLLLDLETRRAIYLMLRQELESLRLEEAKDSPTLEVLVPAVPTALRSYPKRGRMVIKHTAVAFLLALLWIAVFTYGRQLLDDEQTGPFWKSVLRTAGRQLFILRADREKDRPGP